MLWKIIRFVIISLLMVLYWPMNMLFVLLKKHYFIWKKEDKISFWLATPIYWLMFLLTAIIAAPMEALADAAHPPLDGFR